MPRGLLVTLAIGFIVGIVCGRANDAFIAVAIALAMIGIPRLPSSALRIAIVVAVGLGYANGALRGHVDRAPGDARTTAFAATVVDVASEPNDRTRTTLRLADGALALASLRSPAPAVGARLELRGRRERFDGVRNPGEPALADLEAERGIAWHVAHPHVVASAPPDEADPTLWLARLRSAASARVHATLGEPGATILAGALWGERGNLPPALRAEFQDTGTVHVLVTAGLHLGIVAGCAYLALMWLGAHRIGASLVTIAIVWLYAALSGDHLPSMRAATMLSFVLAARAFGRASFSWNALAAAAIVVAAIRPASVTSLSFALSFACVAAIFGFARPLADGFERTGVPHVVAELLGVATATQLGTWPLTASAFLVIAPYAPLANLVVVPLVGVAMLGGFAMLVLAPLPFVGTLVTNLEGTLVDAIVGTVGWAGGLPAAHIVATPPPPWSLAVYAAAAIGAGWALARGRIALAVVALACGSALCLWPPRARDDGLVITAIDVGQADALLIRTPRGHALLVDGGGRLERGPPSNASSAAEDVGERTVVPFLVRDGIHHLDAVLLSHPHGDHAGGIPPVLRALGADAFADSGQAYGGFAYGDALAAARERGTPMREPRDGDVWRTDDGVTLRFYGPRIPYVAGTRSDINENSLVFRLEYGSFAMLFTGDAGAATEARLLHEGLDLRADVLKVGHHGSAYGTTAAFVAAVTPRAAVISVGRENLFGHPAAGTLATLAAAHVRVYRTDHDGAVLIRVTNAASPAPDIKIATTASTLDAAP